MNRKVVSVGAELAMLERVVEGAVDLLDVENIGVDDWASSRGRVSAILALVASRLAQLRRAVIGAEDPGLLWSRHNEAAECRSPGDDPDLLLSAWPAPPQRTGRASRKAGR